MFGQSFHVTDLGAVGFLIILEGLLSADNALVLAIMVRHLPRGLQQKALLYGLGGAFVFRLIAIVFATIVLKQWWLQAIGAIYLLYLPAKHFVHVSKQADSHIRKAGGTFWQTVVAVELADIAFALDSVLAGIGFITKPGIGVQQDKIWVVYLGAVMGIVLLRIAAGAFIRILERFPLLDHVAYILVGWVGVKLAFHAAERLQSVSPNALPFQIPHMHEAVFWGGLAAISIIGGLLAFLRPRKDADRTDDLTDEAAIATDAQDMRIDEPAGEESKQTDR